MVVPAMTHSLCQKCQKLLNSLVISQANNGNDLDWKSYIVIMNLYEGRTTGTFFKPKWLWIKIYWKGSKILVLRNSTVPGLFNLIQYIINLKNGQENTLNSEKMRILMTPNKCSTLVEIVIFTTDK